MQFSNHHCEDNSPSIAEIASSINLRSEREKPRRQNVKRNEAEETLKNWF